MKIVPKTLVLTEPGALRQDSPAEVVTAGVANEEIFAVVVAVAAEHRNCFQVVRPATPTHHTLLVAIWAVGV